MPYLIDVLKHINLYESHHEKTCFFHMRKQRRRSAVGIHMVNLNIRHLKPKLDEMKLILDQQKNIDIFGLCETFLDQTVDNDILSMKGYSFKRKDRSECNLIQSEKGGGIMIYIKQDVQFERRNDMSQRTTFPTIWT